MRRWARPAGRALFIFLACLAVACPAAFFVAAWGEWRCGINGINLVLVSAIAAVILTGCLAGIRLCTAPERRFNGWVLACPWIALVALVIYMATLCPLCPFISR